MVEPLEFSMGASTVMKKHLIGTAITAAFIANMVKCLALWSLNP